MQVETHYLSVNFHQKPHFFLISRVAIYRKAPCNYKAFSHFMQETRLLTQPTEFLRICIFLQAILHLVS